MHHGTTVVHWDAEGGNRASLVYLRLERSCATLTWSRPAWSALKTTGATSSPDYTLSTNPEELIAPGLLNMGGEVASASLEEGFLELSSVKVCIFILLVTDIIKVLIPVYPTPFSSSYTKL